MRANFQKMGEKEQKMSRRGKRFKNLAINKQNLKNILEKGMWLTAVIARNKVLEIAVPIHPSKTDKYINSLH